MQFEKNFNIIPFPMIKWIVYIVVLLIFAPYLSSAKIKNIRFNIVSDKLAISLPFKEMVADTSTKKSRKQEQDEKNKIKEVAKAKRQPKPEKIEPVDNTPKTKKPRRQRRPEGLETPPEIPRRNGN
jgi:hypothetical protein